MSWNAAQFAKRAVECTRRNGLREADEGLFIWLSADALARLEADGGYVENLADHVPTLGQLVAEHRRVHVGLGEPILEPIDDGSVLPNATFDINQYIKTDGVPVDIVSALPLRDRRFTVGEQAHEMIMKGYLSAGGELQTTVKQSRIGGLFHSNGDDDMVGLWCDSQPLSKNTILNRVAEIAVAAAVMFTDPEARGDAACDLKPRSVEIPRRRGIPKRRSEVSVIDVRRRAERLGTSNGDRRPVEHDHRWVTRGHWRNQAFGIGHSQRRRIWIEEHLNGPDDMPVRRPQKVYKVA